MKMFDTQMEVGDVPPQKWLKDAYQRMDEGLDNLLKAGFTREDLCDLLVYDYCFPSELNTAILTMLKHNFKSNAKSVGWISENKDPA